MQAAAATIANEAASHWARHQADRTMVRAATNGNAVVYRRTWPSQDAIAMLGEAEYDPELACDGWLDSTLDLRDGLSVVEVFATVDEAAVLREFERLRQR